MTTKKTSFQFEPALQELESMVLKMEQGQLSLEQSLSYFEKGIAITRQCQTALKQAEQKVAILLKKNNKECLEPFQPDDQQ